MIYSEMWEKLKALEFDTPGASYPFSVRLAKENGWSHRYAKAAILEYKRFVYLASLTEEDLMPSDSVNQVWRLHLTFTRHYWGKFTDILEKRLHKSPSNGGESDLGRRRNQYETACRLYREEFGVEPPEEFWPSVEERFSSRDRFTRVDLAKNLVLQKPALVLGRSVMRFFGVAAFPLSVMGYAMAQSSGPITGSLTMFGWMVVAGIAITIAVFGCLVWRMEHNAKSSDNL